MSKRCPYRHLPYSSCCQHTFRRLMLHSTELFSGPSRRSFVTSTVQQSQPPPEGQRLSHSETSKEKDNQLLRQLLSEISASIDPSLSPVAVSSLRNHAFPNKSEKHDKVPHESSKSKYIPPQPPSDFCSTSSVSKYGLSKSLVQSPLFIRAENGPKQRKRRPTKEDDDRLRRNPWAMALASPVRKCSATGARMPAEFLGE